jgi:hypothetical protein
VVPLIWRAGTSRAVSLASSAHVPQAGDLVHFDLLGQESRSLRVVAVEQGSGVSSVLRLMADAPDIDDYLETLVVPASNGRLEWARRGRGRNLSSSARRADTHRDISWIDGDRRS